MKYVNAIDVSTHKTSITEQELDVFMNSIRYFDYGFMLFKNHYKTYSANILRLKPTSTNKNFDLVVLQNVLQEDDIHPLKLSKVFIYHLKFKWKLTSRIYLKYIKKY
jgi:hypothetical protein